jgi:serine/threonine-protein kinase HipA
LLENLRSRIVREAEALYADVEAENARIAHARPDLSVTLSGESRCLKTILHTVIKEMAERVV